MTISSVVISMGDAYGGNDSCDDGDDGRFNGGCDTYGGNDGVYDCNDSNDGGYDGGGDAYGGNDGGGGYTR
jgi:hypothetical protein